MAKPETLDTSDIMARLGNLPGWSFHDGALRRTYRTNGWKSALLLVNAIGHLAEAAWHHPDIALSWGRVDIVLTTHDAGGVSARDLELAQMIEGLVGWRPGPGSSLEGTPQDGHAYILHD